MSRTNIDIDDELVARVMERYGLTTKKDAVDHALRSLAGQPLLTTEEILAMQGAEPDRVRCRRTTSNRRTGRPSVILVDTSAGSTTTAVTGRQRI